MIGAALQALATFPDRLEAAFSAFGPEDRNWEPRSWEYAPSEPFAPLAQVCHVRDVEIDGYRIRFRRVRDEHDPVLVSLDGFALARERDYANADPPAALAAFRAARAETVAELSTLTPVQLGRPAFFPDYGALTLRGLVHFLCSHDEQHLAGLHWLLGQREIARRAGGERP